MSGAPHALLHLGHALVGSGTVPTDLQVRQPTLEDAYFRLVVADSTSGATSGGSLMNLTAIRKASPVELLLRSSSPSRS